MNLTGIGILLKEDLWAAEIKASLRGEQVSRPLRKYFSFLEHTPRPIMKMRLNDVDDDTGIQHK
jgi:hypothetical protein